MLIFLTKALWAFDSREFIWEDAMILAIIIEITT
jgi:hypothetical protein